MRPLRAAAVLLGLLALSGAAGRALTRSRSLEQEPDGSTTEAAELQASPSPSPSPPPPPAAVDAQGGNSGSSSISQALPPSECFVTVGGGELFVLGLVWCVVRSCPHCVPPALPCSHPL